MRNGHYRYSIDLRLSLASAALTAGGAAIVLAFIYWFAISQPTGEIAYTLEEEVARLHQFFDQEGLEVLMEEIGRSAAKGSADYYALSEENFDVVAGNFMNWPKDVPVDDQIHSFSFLEEDSGGGFPTIHHVRAWGHVLPDGRKVIVGEDVTEKRRLEEKLTVALWIAGAVTIVVSIGMGLVLSHNLLARVNTMNETILQILTGRSGERVPLSGRDDEFEALARHFNRMLDEKERLVAKIREITNDIAHDLRTPLARLRRHVESVLALPLDEEEKQETLERVLGEADAILDTFNALLKIAQIESGTLRDQMGIVDLDAILQAAVELYEPLAEAEGICFELDLTPEVEVRGNKHLLAQSITNLIDNALKYACDADCIEIRTERLADGVACSVRDFGPGVPAADREKVLDRYVRLDSSRSKPGTGLGLSFVAAVVELHGAKLELSDAEPGLRVRIVFPVAPC